MHATASDQPIFSMACRASNLKLSSEALHLIAARFKVLSEPTRLKLILSLQRGERNVSALVQATGATQANVSRHLQTLTEAGVLARRKAGLNVYYAVSDDSIFNLCHQVLGSLERHTARRVQAFHPPRVNPIR
jgi:DNA-binding transcriptional ArsR family regulator